MKEARWFTQSMNSTDWFWEALYDYYPSICRAFSSPMNSVKKSVDALLERIRSWDTDKLSESQQWASWVRELNEWVDKPLTIEEEINLSEDDHRVFNEAFVNAPLSLFDWEDRESFRDIFLQRIRKYWDEAMLILSYVGHSMFGWAEDILWERMEIESVKLAFTPENIEAFLISLDIHNTLIDDEKFKEKLVLIRNALSERTKISSTTKHSPYYSICIPWIDRKENYYLSKEELISLGMNM